MGLESELGEIKITPPEFESSGKINTESFKKDAEALEGFDELKTQELTNKISEHLVAEGQPGSADYVELYSKSAVLDKELGLLKTGDLNAQKIEEVGLPLMINVEQTTPEIIATGKAILTPEARIDLLGSANKLKYKLDQHISKTVQKAAEYYSTELTRRKGLSEIVQEKLGIKQEESSIPFRPNSAEHTVLEELSNSKYITREDAQQKYYLQLRHMMKQRPGLIGMGDAAYFSNFVGDVAQELGDSTQETVNIKRTRSMHELMTGNWVAEELQIYPGFTKAIGSRVEKDFSE